MPGFLGGVLHQDSHAVQGAVVFGMFAVGTVSQVALSRFSSRRVVLAQIEALGLELLEVRRLPAGPPPITRRCDAIPISTSIVHIHTHQGE